MNFDKAFERVIGHEGNHQKDRNDRGNWTSGVIGKGELKGTKYGISAMSYPTEDIANLTLDRAKLLYKRDFWDKNQLDSFVGSVQYQVFDAAVNHGRGNAVRMLQRAVGSVDDGFIGPKTLAQYEAQTENDTLLLFLSERLGFMTNISTFDRYGRGWSRRIALNLTYAAGDNIDGCRD